MAGEAVGSTVAGLFKNRYALVGSSVSFVDETLEGALWDPMYV